MIVVVKYCESRSDKILMVPAQKVISSFLVDAIRMANEAARLLHDIQIDSHFGVVPQERVRSLYQIVHTLKGTATMVPGGMDIVYSLQTLEARLACQPLSQAAAKLDWVQLADHSLTQARDALLTLQTQPMPLPEGTSLAEAARLLAKKPPAAFDLNTAKGIVARVTLSGEAALLWFPVASLTRVLPPTEVGNREMLCLQGQWVPILGVPASLKKSFGLGVKLDAGHVVVAVEEFVSLMGWLEASRVGAKAGLEALVRLSSEKAPAKLPEKVSAPVAANAVRQKDREVA